MESPFQEDRNKIFLVCVCFGLVCGFCLFVQGFLVWFVVIVVWFVFTKAAVFTMVLFAWMRACTAEQFARLSMLNEKARMEKKFVVKIY